MADPRFLLCFSALFLLFCPAFQQSTAALSSPDERVALLQLRSTLGLRTKEWPIKSDPCLIWSGVNCTNGRVTGINISGFRRTRRGAQNPQFSVEALANFTLLSSFNASYFPLPGSIPDWFGQKLPALQVLDLRSCSILGPIPPNIGNLTNLTALYLSGNNLTGLIPSSLGQLSRLSVLDLAHNSLTGSIPPSFTFSNLTFLDMSFNYISGSIPSSIANLSNLRTLNLSSNSLSSSIPAQLGNLSSLVYLDLSYNSFSGSLPEDLRGIRYLQNMLVNDNLLTGSVPGNLFPALTRLQVLSLKNNNFTGQLPNSIYTTRLRFLDVSKNSFTGTLPNVTSDSNPGPSISTFNLSHNLFYGTLTPILTKFNFDLSANYFEGNAPDSIVVSLKTNCLRKIRNQRTAAECSSFYSERGLVFDNFGSPITPARPPTPSKKDNGKPVKTVYIVAGVVGGVLLIAILVALLLLLILCRRRRNTENQRGTGVDTVPVGAGPSLTPGGAPLDFSSLGESFTYEQIAEATDEFDEINLIKNGHTGDLFRGLLSGVPVIIKRVDFGAVKKETFATELEFFSKVSHPRLVPLIGHCVEKENEQFLVYKYMPNGDLASSLFWRTDAGDDRLHSLDWITRLKIATGAAEGLTYLHHECNPPLVHRDIQASSILLDDKYEVRLGSLSEVCAQEGDTHQSRITRFLRLPTTSEQGASGTHTASCAYDVYCFGKVLLELVTGKLGISASSNGKDWMDATLRYISIYDKELVTNIVDPTLIIDEDLLEEVWAMAVVARSCLNPKPARRPLMRYILKALENPAKVVREEHTSSARLRATSSRGSWNAALFGGSWRQSSDVVAVPKVEGGSRTTGSQGSGGHNGGGGDNSSSTRRHSSRDICPEPMDEGNVERLHD